MSRKVAIIMRARNEMPHVRQTLSMLAQQTFQEFDLYAVDSGSDDGTFEELARACAPGHLERISAADYVPGRVLNQAIAKAPHETIILLNADAIPQSTDFLERLLHPILSSQADVVFARQVARPDAHFIVAYDYLRAYDPKTMTPDFFSAVACAFRRERWEKTRFREHGYAEDQAWAKDLVASGARLRFVPEATVEHSHNYAFRELYRKRRRQAETWNQKPHATKQLILCTREMVRDFLYACRRLKPATIPYNMAYRIVIHAAIHAGLKTSIPTRKA